MSNKKEQAYEIVLARINDTTYPAQSYIDEKEIAEELNTSRTPVREALITLSQEGYLKILPKRGIIVLPFTYEDAVDIFQVRQLLEPWLVRTYGSMITKEELAQERILVEKEIMEAPSETVYPGISMMHHPHILLMRKSTNQYVNRILANVEKQALRIPNDRYLNNRYVNSHDKKFILKTHIELIDLIESGNFASAADTMVKHVQLAEKEYMNYWFN